MNERFILRVRFVTAVAVLVAVVIMGRLYVLQIMHGEEYAARADAQFIEPQEPLQNRDAIYFSTKDGEPFAAATMQDGFALAVEPLKVPDIAALYAEIGSLTGLTQEEFEAKLTSGARYVVLARRLDETLGAELKEKSLPGVVLERDRWRYYPGESLAAQTIGFVAYNGNTQEGRYGLERYYEQTLSRTGENLYANFFVELFGGVQAALEGKQTGDIVTTIEPAVQTELERTLAAYATAWTPQLTGGVVMDPQTGEILAMAVSPTFDLNHFNVQEDVSLFGNPLVESVFEMGSIMKPLTMAAGIDSGAVTEHTTYEDTGCITVDTKKICNYDLRARGVVSMQEVLSQSLNLGASFVATKMGPEMMREYFLNRYRLGEETGIDLPGEVHGLVGNLESSRQVEYDTASFGQGIAVTPIEMVRALNVLASGGLLVTPHLVREVRYDTGITRALGWGEGERVLSPQTVTVVSRMLTTVVDSVLAGGSGKLEHYSVAAKTGTAQIANPGGGGYYTDRFLHSFFGYFPSYDAQFLIFLFAHEPQGASFASQTLATPFRSLTEFLINYYHVPPDR